MFRVKLRTRVWAAALAVGTAPCFADNALAAAETTGLDTVLITPNDPSSGFHIERLGNQGIKLTSKNSENSYGITVVGSNAESTVPVGDAWQKSLGVEVEGKLGAFLKTDLSTRFTEFENTLDAAVFGRQDADRIARERRGLEEFSFSTQFLGDRVVVSSSRRASNYAALDRAVVGSSGSYEQDRFNAWVWRSDRSSLSIEGVMSRIDSGFRNLGQAPLTRNEESQQLRSKFTFGRAGVFVAQRESLATAPDRSSVLSRQSDIETGATLGLSDLRHGPLLSLLPDSVWVSTNFGSVVKGSTAVSEASPLTKSAIGMTRKWDSGSVNVNYWRSAVQSPASAADESLWQGRGMDVGGTLKSGPLSVSGNVSWSAAENIAAMNNKAESNINGSLFLTWARPAWPKLSAGMTNYAYQAAFFDYSGLTKNSLTRYELSVDSSPLLLSHWADRDAQLKFIASYQDNSSRSEWAQTAPKGVNTENVFLGFKFTRALLP